MESFLKLLGRLVPPVFLDPIAGITVGLVVLPLAMAISIASGLTPQTGVYCAMGTGFLISALGGGKLRLAETHGRLRSRGRGHYCGGANFFSPVFGGGRPPAQLRVPQPTFAPARSHRLPE